MTKREKYTILLEQLPDLIDLPSLINLLGGWGEKQVFQMIKSGHIKSIVSPGRGRPHMFPKTYIIDFLCSDFYKTEQKNEKIGR